jgi:hypothetical protein
MQKIIPFKKESKFKDNVSEITSISLEHTLHKEKESLITGEFLVSGEYKVVETSSVIDKFSFKLPFDIHLDDKYDISNVFIDIDDFYYEIINNNTLKVNIDVLIDKIKEVKEEVREEAEPEKEELSEEIKVNNVEIAKLEDVLEREENISEEREVETEIIKEIEKKTETIETIEEKIEMKENISDLFDDINGETKTDSTYRVYIVKEEDTLDTIMLKYSVNKEVLSEYNTLETIKKGDKIIIPCMYSEKI